MWSERIQTCLGPASPDVSSSKCLLTCTAVERCEVLLANCVSASPVQLLDLLTIRSFQWAERADVTRLQLVRSMRRYATQGDVVLKAKLENLERFVRPKTIADKQAGFAACPQLGLGLKHEPQPIEANLRVCVTGL